MLFELEFLILDAAVPAYIQIKLHLEQMAPAPLGSSARPFHECMVLCIWIRAAPISISKTTPPVISEVTCHLATSMLAAFCFACLRARATFIAWAVPFPMLITTGVVSNLSISACGYWKMTKVVSVVAEIGRITGGIHSSGAGARVLGFTPANTSFRHHNKTLRHTARTACAAWYVETVTRLCAVLDPLSDSCSWICIVSDGVVILPKFSSTTFAIKNFVVPNAHDICCLSDQHRVGDSEGRHRARVVSRAVESALDVMSLFPSCRNTNFSKTAVRKEAKS